MSFCKSWLVSTGAPISAEHQSLSRGTLASAILLWSVLQVRQALSPATTTVFMHYQRQGLITKHSWTVL